MSTQKTIIFMIILFTLSCNTEDPNYVKTPQWSKGAVWYQIFPERFRNGNRANDPTEKEVIGNYINEQLMELNS